LRPPFTTVVNLTAQDPDVPPTCNEIPPAQAPGLHHRAKRPFQAEGLNDAGRSGACSTEHVDRLSAADQRPLDHVSELVREDLLLRRPYPDQHQVGSGLLEAFAHRLAVAR